MIQAKLFGYSIKFYGDSYSLKYLSSFYDYCVDISNEKFLLVDDLKMFIHKTSDLDCISIDGDLLLHHPIKIPSNKNYDVFFELAETSKNVLKRKYNDQHGYFDLVDIFDKYIDNKLFKHWNNNLRLSCNVGLIKFNNHPTKNLFLSEYYKMREFFLDNIEPSEQLLSSKYIPSIIVAQYNFGLLCEKYKTKVAFLKDHNNYTHFYGKIKFSDRTKKAVNSILNKKSLM